MDPALEQAHHNPVRPRSLDHIPQRGDRTQNLSAGERRSRGLGIPYVSGYQEPQLRMFADILADVLQQRAAANQQ